jgi:ketosteroid isomerase-like protein
MTEEVNSPLAAERSFFASLVQSNVEGLEALLMDDFILIDVMSGSEVPKSVLLALVGSGQLSFEAIDPADVRVRFYHTTAIVTGRTQMRGQFAETPFSASSRYTHVYVEQQGRWRLATAQGTQTAPEPPSPAP